MRPRLEPLWLYLLWLYLLWLYLLGVKESLREALASLAVSPNNPAARRQGRKGRALSRALACAAWEGGPAATPPQLRPLEARASAARCPALRTYLTPHSLSPGASSSWRRVACAWSGRGRGAKHGQGSCDRVRSRAEAGAGAGAGAGVDAGAQVVGLLQSGITLFTPGLTTRRFHFSFRIRARGFL